jgi:protein TonB
VPHPQKQTPPQVATSGQPAPNILHTNEISETQIKATKGSFEKPVITNSVTLTRNKDPDSSKSTAALQPPQKVHQSATKTKSTKIKKAKTRREHAKRKKQSNNTKPKRLAHTSAHIAPGAGRKHKGRAPKGISQGTAFTGPGLSNPRPSYPAKARSKGYQGRVLLVVIVSKIGRAKSVRLKKSSGHAILDQAAIKSVKKWRFRPARKNGVPVPARVIVPVNFRLRG